MHITLTPEQIQQVIESQNATTPPEFNGTTLEYFLHQYTYAMQEALIMLTHLHQHINKLQHTRKDVVAALQKACNMSEPQAQVFYAYHKHIFNNEEIMSNVVIRAMIKPSTRKPRKSKQPPSHTRSYKSSAKDGICDNCQQHIMQHLGKDFLCPKSPCKS